MIETDHTFHMWMQQKPELWSVKPDEEAVLSRYKRHTRRDGERRHWRYHVLTLT